VQILAMNTPIIGEFEGAFKIVNLLKKDLGTACIVRIPLK
jgi:hypothetical protein